MADYSERNPSPPCLSAKENELMHGDDIGNTLFSKKWVLGTLMKLLKKTQSEKQQEGPIEIDDEFDSELCELWDMTMNEDVALYLQNEVSALDILLDVIVRSQAPRITEICVGILGNMACHHQVCMEMSKNEQLVELMMAALDNPDPPTLVETTRFLRVCLDTTETVHLWSLAIHKSTAFNNLIFILENSLNVDLLSNCSQVVDKILDTSDTLLDSWAGRPLVKAVCEAIKQIKIESHIDVLESLLHVLQLISTREVGVEALVKSEFVCPLLCQFISECGQDEGGVIRGREGSLAACFSVLSVILTAEPQTVLVALDKDPRIMKILIAVLEATSRNHRKKMKSESELDSSYSSTFNDSGDIEELKHKEMVDLHARNNENENDKQEKADDPANSGENIAGSTEHKEGNSDPLSMKATNKESRSSISSEPDVDQSAVKLPYYYGVALNLLKDIVSECTRSDADELEMLHNKYGRHVEKILYFAHKVHACRDTVDDMMSILSQVSQWSDIHSRLVHIFHHMKKREKQPSH